MNQQYNYHVCNIFTYVHKYTVFLKNVAVLLATYYIFKEWCHFIGHALYL